MQQTSTLDHTVPRVNVLGVGIDPVDMDEAVGRIEQAIATRHKGYVCVTGVHGVMEAQRDQPLRTIVNSSFLTVPDGKPTVWVGRMQGYSQIAHVPGPQLMLHLCARSAAKGYRHFLYGGAEGVAEQLAHTLTEKFPGLRIVGSYTPPYRPLNVSEQAELIALVAKLKPDITWVGLSTPKQERFMAEYLARLDTTVMIGVGAAFDIHTGRIQDAPDWMKRLGLAWVNRLAQEPRRLWKRYAVIVPTFLCAITAQFLRLKRYQLRSDCSEVNS